MHGASRRFSPPSSEAPTFFSGISVHTSPQVDDRDERDETSEP